MRNLRLALRTLARTPFVTTVAALSLGLGIGANSAIYSIFYRMVRQELPVADADRLVNFSAPGPKDGSTSCGEAGLLRRRIQLPDVPGSEKAKLIAVHRDRRPPRHRRERQLSSGARSRARAARLGQLFPDAASASCVRPIAVAHRRRGERAAPPSCSRTGSGRPASAPTPAVDRQDAHGERQADDDRRRRTEGIQRHDRTARVRRSTRRSRWAPRSARASSAGSMTAAHTGSTSFGRLAPGATIEQARAQVNAVYQPIIRDVEAPLQTEHARLGDEAISRQAGDVIEPGARGQSGMRQRCKRSAVHAIRDHRARAAHRLREHRQSAHGARHEPRDGDGDAPLVRRHAAPVARRSCSRRRYARRHRRRRRVLLFASWTLQGIAALAAARRSRHDDVRPELGGGCDSPPCCRWRPGIAFGLFPALHSTRPDLVTALRNNSGKLAGGRTARRFRSTLATAQIALAMALLMSAGLFLKSLWKVERVGSRHRVERLVTFSVSPGQSGYDSVRTRALFARIEEELAALPGASAVTSAMVPLIAGSNWSNSVRVAGLQESDENNVPTRQLQRRGRGPFPRDRRAAPGGARVHACR